MIDRPTIRREFLRQGTPCRLKTLASNLAAIGECFGAGAADVKAKIDESVWMIEWAVPDEGPDVQTVLVELQKMLYEWRAELGELASNVLARRLAGARARAWSERLVRLSACDEAVE